jgi:hypothetical protein
MLDFPKQTWNKSNTYGRSEGLFFDAALLIAVMGPGGYKFGDYWWMGLLLEVIVVLVAIPLIFIFWLLGAY